MAHKTIAVFACLVVSVAATTNTNLSFGPAKIQDDEDKLSLREKELIVRMLVHETFLKEAEAVPEQREKIKNAINKLNKSNKSVWEDEALEKQQKLDKLNEIQMDAFEELMSCLLPHQKNRLRQVLLQNDLIDLGGRYARLISSRLDKGLGLTSAQQKLMNEISEANDEKLTALSKKFEQDVKAVLKSEKDDTLKLLTETQNKLLKDKLGDKPPGMSNPARAVFGHYLSR